VIRPFAFSSPAGSSTVAIDSEAAAVQPKSYDLRIKNSDFSLYVNQINDLASFSGPTEKPCLCRGSAEGNKASNETATVSHKCHSKSAADVFSIGALTEEALSDERWKYSSRLWPPSCSRLSMPLQCGLTRGAAQSTAAESPPINARAIHFGLIIFDCDETGAWRSERHTRKSHLPIGRIIHSVGRSRPKAVRRLVAKALGKARKAAAVKSPPRSPAFVLALKLSKAKARKSRGRR
jgi:hypothetical protein